MNCMFRCPTCTMHSCAGGSDAEAVPAAAADDVPQGVIRHHAKRCARPLLRVSLRIGLASLRFSWLILASLGMRRGGGGGAVRSAAVAAMAKLIPLNPRLDPLMTELVSSAKAADGAMQVRGRLYAQHGHSCP